MATYDLTESGYAGSQDTAKLRTQYVKVDQILANGDVLQLFDLEKNEVPLALAMKVVAGSDGTTPTCAVGYTGGTTNAILAATAITVAAEGTVTTGAGAQFNAMTGATAADTVDALIAVTGTPTVACELEFELITIKTSLV